ncbi:D-2-hydroxyacid dehydrogenase, partial [Oscillospiraceae bacterium OttesenSCG-928-F05]|nr:D-2-hydroxyacid dehydrogenase [Oscillospiraceae bacterium OttesenSCG-928-F05]
SGSTVLILGAGDIGRETALRLKGFGCRILGLRRSPGGAVEGYDAVYGMEALMGALSEADYVLNILPATKETARILGTAQFAVMKPTAYLINIGRGTTVDTDALVFALQSGLIAGAALDVTEPEPLPAESPLWAMDNVLITPHASGFSAGADRRRLELFCDLLTRYLAGEPLYHTVDFDKGY